MSVSLISDILCDELCQQYSHEKYNANFYLVIAGFLKNKGLDKLAKIMEDQHDEEIKHSLMIYEFLTNMNSPFTAREVDLVELDIFTITDISEAYLDRELVTTQDLTDIKLLCIQENNSVAEEFLRKMIQLQENELAEASTFKDNADLTGNDWWKVKVWNDSLS